MAKAPHSDDQHVGQPEPAEADDQDGWVDPLIDDDLFDEEDEGGEPSVDMRAM
jgi:hypothetical protein